MQSLLGSNLNGEKMIQVPLEPYWVNAANWFINKYGTDQQEYYRWLADQGVQGLPMLTEFTDHLKFIDPDQALLFRLRWA